MQKPGPAATTTHKHSTTAKQSTALERRKPPSEMVAYFNALPLIIFFGQ